MSEVKQDPIFYDASKLDGQNFSGDPGKCVPVPLEEKLVDVFLALSENQQKIDPQIDEAMNSHFYDYFERI